VNLEATLVTPEQGTDMNRITFRGFKCVTDAPTVYGSLSYRDGQSQTSVDTTEVLINSRTDRCDFMRSTRYGRIKSRIPSGTAWTFNAGVVPDVTTEGQQ
jgi:hypothetical protein